MFPPICAVPPNGASISFLQEPTAAIRYARRAYSTHRHLSPSELTGTTPLQQTLQRFHRPGILSQSASDTHCRITCHVAGSSVKQSAVSRLTMADGKFASTGKRSLSGRCTVTNPQPERRAAPAESTAAPGIPLEPQTNKACPYMPLWASSARGFTNALTSSHVTYPNPHPERSANASLTPGGRNMISPFTIIL